MTQTLYAYMNNKKIIIIKETKTHNEIIISHWLQWLLPKRQTITSVGEDI
jgi:hypothetical protein